MPMSVSVTAYGAAKTAENIEKLEPKAFALGFFLPFLLAVCAYFSRFYVGLGI